MPQSNLSRPPDALSLAGGQVWFTHCEVLERARASIIVPNNEVPPAWLGQLSAPRPNFAALSLDRPRIMAILNVTPDSFSDGGTFVRQDIARQRVEALITQGADILDIGGESTRPGAQTVPVDIEIERVLPAIRAARAGWTGAISIDTRKALVADAALAAGATIINDVSALLYDPMMAQIAAKAQAPVILMHAQGVPETMQDDPNYQDVLLDVYDALAAAISRARGAGIALTQIVVDPGIGFGKTLEHNLALLRGISLLHGLGVPILLGASRKTMIGTIANVPDASDRMPGSIAIALAAVAQGVQILRVHDFAQTKQALALWRAVTTGER